MWFSKYPFQDLPLFPYCVDVKRDLKTRKSIEGKLLEIETKSRATENYNVSN